MKIPLLSALAACLLMLGCAPSGEATGKAEAEPMPVTDLEKAQLPYQGPSGGGKMDQTSPNMPASTSMNGTTDSAFPSTVKPGQGE